MIYNMLLSRKIQLYLLAECVTGPAGIVSCEDLPDGWYQLCKTCDSFAHCQENGLLQMPCPSSLQWDDNKKMCVRHSKTCKLSMQSIISEQLYTNFDFDEICRGQISRTSRSLQATLTKGSNMTIIKNYHKERCLVTFDLH